MKSQKDQKKSTSKDMSMTTGVPLALSVSSSGS